MALKVATYEQILTILSQLAENYSNFFDVYYEMFYSTVPSDVVLKVYDENGQQQTITLPNRAKDQAYMLNGEGSPNGVLTAHKGSIYQDLLNGTFYLNIDGSVSGWTQIISKSELDKIIISGSVHPEGNITASKGTLFTDKQNGVLYIKTTETGNTGWLNVSADLDGVATSSLDNLTEEGEKHFANLSLSDLNDEGERRFAQKEDIENKTLVVASYSTDVQYPSARAVYNALTAGLATREKLTNKTPVLNAESTNEQYPTAKVVYETARLKEDVANKIAVITEDSTGAQYPSAKAVYDLGFLKANSDLSNVSTTAFGNLLYQAQISDKEILADWLSPNYDAVTELPKVDGTCYQTGWLLFQTGAANNGAYTIKVGRNNDTVGDNNTFLQSYVNLFPVSRGDVYSCSPWSTIHNLFFIPVKGVPYGA